MAERPSYAGFWALLRMALRLHPREYRFNNLTMERLNGTCRLADIVWHQMVAVYTSEVMGRRVSYVFLRPVRPIRDARRRRQLERRVADELETFGYRLQKPNPKEKKWSLRFERAMDGKLPSMQSWIRLLNAADPLERRTVCRTLPDAIRSLLRRGWRASGLSMNGTVRRLSGAGRWTLRSYPYWAIREGIYLTVDLWPEKRIPRMRLETDSETARFVAGVIREFKKLGMREPVEYSGKGSGYPRFLSGMSFSRSRIPPQRLLQTLNRLQELKPTELNGRRLR